MHHLKAFSNETVEKKIQGIFLWVALRLHLSRKNFQFIFYNTYNIYNGKIYLQKTKSLRRGSTRLKITWVQQRQHASRKCERERVLSLALSVSRALSAVHCTCALYLNCKRLKLIREILRSDRGKNCEIRKKEKYYREKFPIFLSISQRLQKFRESFEKFLSNFHEISENL